MTSHYEVTRCYYVADPAGEPEERDITICLRCTEPSTYDSPPSLNHAGRPYYGPEFVVDSIWFGDKNHTQTFDIEIVRAMLGKELFDMIVQDSMDEAAKTGEF